MNKVHHRLSSDAEAFWNNIPPDIRERLLNNVYCTQCRKMTTITDYTGRIENGDLIRRSSRSVAANISEAFRKRRYPKTFVSKLSDCEAEAAETQVWIKFAFNSGYLDEKTFNRLTQSYDNIIGKLVNMARKPENWTI